MPASALEQFPASCSAQWKAEIDATKYGYYVQPEILHWEDRATEWSGQSDRVEIQLIVRSMQTKEEVANVSYKGKSSAFSFGGDHPQDLIVEPTEAFVDSLYK